MTGTTRPRHRVSALGTKLTVSAWNGSRQFRPILILTVLLVIGLATTQQGFLTWQNIQNLLTGTSSLWVVSVGMTFVVITAGADLSVSAIAALTGIFLAKLVAAGVPGWPAVLITLAFGTVVGAMVNGALIGRLRLSFFVVTLASMTALTGVVNIWSGTKSYVIASPVTAQIGVNETLGLPNPIWIMIVTFLLAVWLLRWTYFGRDLFAVGGSLTAARLSGLRTTRTLILAYAVSALCATIAGLITIGRIGVAAPNVDANLPLQAVAAVLLGGTSLIGGTGGVGGTAIGVIFLGTLQNGLSIAGVSSFWQQIVTGVILVLAVLGDQIPAAREQIRRRMKPKPESRGRQGADVESNQPRGETLVAAASRASTSTPQDPHAAHTGLTGPRTDPEPKGGVAWRK